MSQRVRLVVYRKEIEASTSESSYELDLQGAPGISLNFQFSDIKEPQTRKASYSQTFKLPFTDNNNEFFQNWYNVNADTLMFDTRKRFKGILYVGTNPQFEGFIQLRSVYQKARLYEVVLLSNTADLFTNVGNKPLKDAFLNDDGVSYTDYYNHDFTESNLKASWDGTADGFLNVDGDSLRDATADVQKIMYDMRVTKPNFFYNNNYERYLNMSNDAIAAFPNTFLDAQQYQVPITQLRPSIQLKELITKVISSNGFSFTSTFLNSDYFSKLYMTLGGYLGEEPLPLRNGGSFPAGQSKVGNASNWGFLSDSGTGGSQQILNTDGDEILSGQMVDPESTDVVIPVNLVSSTTGCDDINDAYTFWNPTTNVFERKFEACLNMQVRFKLKIDRLKQPGTEYFYVIVSANECDEDGNENGNVWASVSIPQQIIMSGSPTPASEYLNDMVFNIPLNDMPIGGFAKFRVRIENLQMDSGGASTCYIRYGTEAAYSCCSCLKNVMTVNWASFTTFVYGAGQGGIDIPSCIDPNIAQSDFLLDIIQRFNLVIIPDQEDPTNLLIEPYNDYLALGSVKQWTEKLDTSKEIIVRDTTTLQKAEIRLTDLEDVDLANIRIKQEVPTLNVYGHYDEFTTNNNFAQGVLSNKAICSPYINGKIYYDEDDSWPTWFKNLPVHYEFTYKVNDGVVENPCEPTKPKLYFYRGVPATALNYAGDTATYYMHNQNVADSEIEAFSFTTFPICTPYEIEGTGNTNTLGVNTRSLYFDAKPPLVGDLTVFNYNQVEGTWFNNALYGLYWRGYLNTIYNKDARIMECYLNLDEVDIATFDFNDEIFIKDTYWRILKIENYQVGVKATTKVTLLKIIDTGIPCFGCEYVNANDASGSNLFADAIYWWCPKDDPSCNPALGDIGTIGIEALRDIVANPECCVCEGGTPLTGLTWFADENLYPCLADTGSWPIDWINRVAPRSIYSSGETKTIFTRTMGSSGLTIGSDMSKYSRSLISPTKDDIVIKYNNTAYNTPKIHGEMHRFVLTGNTDGNTTGYAYSQGNFLENKISIPYNCNATIRILAVTTVVGGSSSTSPVGTTESFAYYTGFINYLGTVSQLGTAGGVREYELTQSGKTATCTLNVTVSHGVIQFGLNDTDADTKRTWALSVEMSLQNISNLSIPFGISYALFQNGDNILFENSHRLEWN